MNRSFQGTIAACESRQQPINALHVNANSMKRANPKEQHRLSIAKPQNFGHLLP